MVYSSYDYAAPLRETRQIRDKLSQTKLIGLFTRVSTDLLKTEMIGNGTGYSVHISLSRQPYTETKLINDRYLQLAFGHGFYETLILKLDLQQSNKRSPAQQHR